MILLQKPELRRPAKWASANEHELQSRHPPKTQKEMLKLDSRGHNNTSTSCSISICKARNIVLVTIDESQFESFLSKFNKCEKAHIGT